MTPNTRKTDVDQLLLKIAADVKKLYPRSAPSTKHLGGIAGNDLYEAYLFMRVLSAAQRAGATLELLGEQTMKRTREIIFRRSPGTLHHASGTAPDYTFALMRWPDREPDALFVGIKAQGFSGVTHECDLLLLPHGKAKFAQRHPHYPLFRSANLYVEAKFNSVKISLPTARALIGVHSDLWLSAVVLACHGELATNAGTYLRQGPWCPTAAGFGDVHPASNGHNQFEDHLEALF